MLLLELLAVAPQLQDFGFALFRLFELWALFQRLELVLELGFLGLHALQLADYRGDFELGVEFF